MGRRDPMRRSSASSEPLGRRWISVENEGARGRTHPSPITLSKGAGLGFLEALGSTMEERQVVGSVGKGRFKQEEQEVVSLYLYNSRSLMKFIGRMQVAKACASLKLLK